MSQYIVYQLNVVRCKMKRPQSYIKELRFLLTIQYKGYEICG